MISFQALDNILIRNYKYVANSRKKESIFKI